MNERPSPSIVTGAAAGGLATAPLLALLYLASHLAGTPFVAFSLFDWLARTLPGPIITFGIDLIVSVIRGLNLGATDRAAKTAEGALAILLVVIAGMALGGLLFALLRRAPGRAGGLPGLTLGAIAGGVLAALGLAFPAGATAHPVVSAAVVGAACLAWGWSLVWLYNALLERPVSRAETPAEARAIDRRQFLVRVGGATAAITVAGAGVGALLSRRLDEAAPAATAGGEAAAAPPPAWSDLNPLPNAGDPLAPAPGTRLEFTPVRDHYRIDINLRPVAVAEDGWKLQVFGQVNNPLELTLDDLRTKYEPVDQFVTLSCISNPLGGDLISTQRWTGVPLKHVLEDAGLRGRTGFIDIRSADGFHETLDVATALRDERIMLAYAWDGLPLTVDHGFPLRIYIPDLYGMKQPKWILSLEITDEPREGYWVARGWDEVARVRATSVIDTVATENLIQENGRTLVPVGGIAYAGARGISKVEVQVDDGEWQEARLRAPISGTTWVIWRFDWPFEAGDHTFFVRCVDGQSTPQIERVQDARPSGATGVHRRRASLRA